MCEGDMMLFSHMKLKLTWCFIGIYTKNGGIYYMVLQRREFYLKSADSTSHE